MIRANSQEELSKEPCPRCNTNTLTMTNVMFSCPLQFTIFCTNCSFEEFGEGQKIKILYGEEAVRKRPEMYLDHEDPKWRKLAEEVIAANNPELGELGELGEFE